VLVHRDPELQIGGQQLPFPEVRRSSDGQRSCSLASPPLWPGGPGL
jgi:hypothetical protein